MKTEKRFIALAAALAALALTLFACSSDGGGDPSDPGVSSSEEPSSSGGGSSSSAASSSSVSSSSSAAPAVPKCGEAEYDPETQLCDSRDKQVYGLAEIEGQVWLAKNLNYEPDEGSSWCYGNDEENCEKYGRLYDWDTAMEACPEGFRLPSDEDWDELMEAVGGSSTAGMKLKAASGWNSCAPEGEDYVCEGAYGFSALPGGYYNNGSFNGAGDYGYWWSSTEVASGYAWSRGMYSGYDNVLRDHGGKSSGYSVRCLQD